MTNRRVSEPDADADASDGLGPERLTRNWNELLQELRVVQTGSQILAGFLLTVPFSARFEELDRFQVNVYLSVLCGAVLTTGFVVAPVAFHRHLFRRGQRRWLVGAANRSARTGLLLLAVTSSGVLLLTFDITVDRTAALIASTLCLVFFLALWALVPWWSGRPALPGRAGPRE